MILSNIIPKAKTTIIRAVRLVLGQISIEEVAWARASSDPKHEDFSCFSEWATKADCEAFDHY